MHTIHGRVITAAEGITDFRQAVVGELDKAIATCRGRLPGERERRLDSRSEILIL
jgi:hypothetical protein